MKLLTYLAATLVFATAVNIECDLAQCPPTHCSDPRTPEGECCPTCEDALCVWRGCVYFGAHGARWYPDPCTICGCYSEREVCTAILCEEPECFGYPLVTDPDACCPRCDWGIAEDQCGSVPVANMSLYATLGDGAQCHYEVTRHECNKRYLIRNGEIHECRSKRQKRSVLTTDCEDFHRIFYMDIGKCVAKRLRESPQDLYLGSRCTIRV